MCLFLSIVGKKHMEPPLAAQTLFPSVDICSHSFHSPREYIMYYARELKYFRYTKLHKVHVADPHVAAQRLQRLKQLTFFLCSYKCAYKCAYRDWIREKETNIDIIFMGKMHGMVGLAGQKNTPWKHHRPHRYAIFVIILLNIALHNNAK